MKTFLQSSLVAAFLLFIVVVAVSINGEISTRRQILAQVVKSVSSEVDMSGVLNVSDNLDGYTEAPDTNPDVQMESYPTTRSSSGRSTTKFVTESKEAAATETTSTQEVSPQPEAPANPSWCPPPGVYIPIDNNELGVPGLCATEQELRPGEFRIKLCSLVDQTVVCYIIKIKCDAGGTCTVRVTTPFLDIPSSFLPNVKCETLPSQPQDPSNVHRMKCAFEPSDLLPEPPVLPGVCYIVDPKTLRPSIVECPPPVVTPPVHPTTPPNREDAIPSDPRAFY